MKQNKRSFHYEAKYSLIEYLEKWGIPMLGHIDTRAVVKKIRSEGTMPAVLSIPLMRMMNPSSY